MCEPLSILSENLTVDHWNRLLDTLRPVLREGRAAYEGIILTHGTDTLAYTAALLDQLLAGTPLPVATLLKKIGRMIAAMMADCAELAQS